VTEAQFEHMPARHARFGESCSRIKSNRARRAAPDDSADKPVARSVLVAFTVFYLAWRVAVRVLREIGATVRLITPLLTRPPLWLAHRQALQVLRSRQRARTMQELRSLALPPGGGLR
jgi:hypothetical protein